MSRVFKLPELAEGVGEAEVLEIPVSEGDEVEEGQTVLTVETDKATVDVPSPYSGRIEEIKVSANDVVHTDDAVMVYAEAGGEDQPAESEEANGSAPPEPEEKSEETRNEEEPRAGAPEEGRPVPASPATRRLARELDVDLRAVEPSGAEGRVTKEDVEAAAGKGVEAEKEEARREEKPELEEAAPAEAAREAAPPVEAPKLPDFSKWGEVERVPLRSVRRSIARRMTQAWRHIPHAAHRERADVTALEEFRRQQKSETGLDGLTLSIYVMKAAVAALKEHPRLNASLDAGGEEIILKHHYHFGVAVDTDRGLIVPVVRDVDRKSIAELSEEMQALIERTRSGETSLEEIQGGTFTITNVGALGGTGLDPIINFPQAAILGMAQARYEPVVVEKPDSAESEGTGARARVIEPRLILPMVLAFDHRVVDGADAARFMNMLKEILEDTDRLMVMI